MENLRKLIHIFCQLKRRVFICGFVYKFGILGDFADKRLFLFRRENKRLAVIFHAVLGLFFKHAANSCVSVLNVENGILGAFLNGKVEVEIKMSIRVAEIEEKSRVVNRHFVKQRGERNRFT